MFLRELEPRECPDHRICRTAALFECDNCHGEFLVHGLGHRMKKSYCSPACRKTGSYATMARAEEAKKKFNRIKYGRSYEKKAP